MPSNSRKFGIQFQEISFFFLKCGNTALIADSVSRDNEACRVVWLVSSSPHLLQVVLWNVLYTSRQRLAPSVVSTSTGWVSRPGCNKLTLPRDGNGDASIVGWCCVRSSTAPEHFIANEYYISKSAWKIVIYGESHIFLPVFIELYEWSCESGWTVDVWCYTRCPQKSGMVDFQYIASGKCCIFLYHWIEHLRRREWYQDH